jgi:hypothetical protein
VNPQKVAQKFVSVNDNNEGRQSEVRLERPNVKDQRARPVMLRVVEASVGRAPLHRMLCRLFSRAFTAAPSSKT